MTTRPGTIVEVLRERAGLSASRPAYAFLPDGRTETSRLTFADVDVRARAIAAVLSVHAEPGDRVLITYPATSGLEYVTGFLGCLYAGLIAVPCDARVGRSGAERLAWISQDAEPAVVLGPGDVGADLFGVPLLDVGSVSDGLADDYHDRLPGVDDIALLQYTSGSTRRPRGVMVSHGNIMANERAIAGTCRHDADSTFVGWLPLFHDMGLIANVLQPLYLGSLSVLIPPTAFLADPLCWPAAISRYRGVTSGGPNFAYDLCAGRAPRDPDSTVDLSSWRVAFNGAEVVRAATLRRFVAAFGPYGFTPETFFPCYGLAEATLIVTGSPRGTQPKLLRAEPDALRHGQLRPADDDGRAQTLVSSGRLAGEVDVTVVDLDTGTVLADGELGEVCVSGGSVAQGYWRRPDESAAVFTRTGSGTVLRTGDLGALLAGELYLVGRLKDMVVIRGQNFYPDDIEWTAERAHPALRPSCGAAFAVEDGEHERLAIVYEVAPRADGVDLAEVGAAVRAAVADRHGIEAHLVALVERGSVPKTTSGKVRRGGCRAAWSAGTLPVVGVSLADDTAGSAVDRAELEITRVLAGTAGPARSLGLDSLGATELGYRLERRYGVRLPLHTLLGSVSTTEVAGAIASTRPTSPIVEAEPDGSTVGPLLPTQAALWFENEVAAGSTAYHLVRALGIRGRLDRNAMDRALAGLVEAHPALRTRFMVREGEVRQLVGTAGRIVVVDLPAASAEEIAARLRHEISTPLPLGGEPPVRLTLLRHGDDHHTLVLAAHHAVVDFWSLVVIVRELFTRYAREAGVDGPAPVVPGCTPIVHARRLAADLHGGAGAAHRRYWTTRLAGAPSTMQLPTDRPRPTQRSFRGAAHSFQLPADLTERLRAMVDRQGDTLFTVAFAGFRALLSRLTGERDIVIGTAVHGRDHADLANVVGCLVNVVPVRGRLRPQDGFAALLTRTGQDLRADLAHAALPLADIVRLRQPDRRPGVPSLIQVMAVWHGDPGGRDDGIGALALAAPSALRLPGAVDVDVIAVPQQWTHVDLTLNIADLGGTLTATLEYNTDLFDPDTIGRLAESFVVLLQDAVARPEIAIERLRLLTEHDELIARRAGTGPRRSRQPDRTLHGLVLDQARRTPDAVAVSAEVGDLTYRAMTRWAAGVAGALLDRGVAPEEPVAVLMTRSAALPAAALGILLSGAAYLPVDPAEPAQRLSHLLRSAGVRTVLVHGAGHPELSADLAVIDVSQCRTRPGAASRPVHPDQLAYVIHTSGSTGRPKGVAMPHRAIVNRLLWMQEQFALDRLDRVLHKTPVTFDVSLWELFWPLTSGACLVVAPPDVHRDPEPLASTIIRQQVTTAHFVPTLLRTFLRQLPRVDLPALARIICSGEELPPSLVDQAADAIDARLFNLYGPTEAAVDVTWWRCTPGEAVPIGRPITNVAVHVLGPGDAPQPVGVAGEIHLAGTCLARGYLNAPATTAASFVPMPSPTEPGARMYRTGDSGRRRADGAVRYLGRRDRQVKIAGVRVEPAETEQILRTLPGVSDVVCVDQPGAGGPRLVAYIVPTDPDRPVDLPAVRAALADTLPAAFVPVGVMQLSELPTTPSGKLDRTTLPPIARADTRPLDEHDSPLVQRIARIWAEVLGAEHPIAADQDFFAAGGDSLIAVGLVGRLRDVGVTITVAELVEVRTVAEVAALAHRRGPVPSTPPLVPFALCAPEQRSALPADVLDAYPISMAQRAVLSRQLAGRSSAAGADHEVYVTSVRVRSPFDTAVLQVCADDLLHRHAYLRSSFDLAAEPEPLQLVRVPSPAPLTVIDLRGQPPGQQDEILTRWLRDERTRPLNPDTGPLVRFTAHRRDDTEFQFTVSSFALDGWCTATILTELLTDHAAAQRGRTLPRPALRGGYADFVALELAARRSDDHRRFWRAQLTGARACLVPTERHGDLEVARLTHRHVLDVAPGHVTELRRLAREQGVSLKSVLLAAHLRVMREFAETDDVLTVLETNGRPEHLDGDRMVGVFNNLVPLRVAMPAGSWRDLAAAAWSAEQRVLPHRRHPFASIDREHHLLAMANTLFVYTHFHIYRELAADPDIELLGGVAPDQTYLPLTAHFNLDAQTQALRLLLDYDPARLTDAAVRRLSRCYDRAIAGIATAPDEPWHATAMVSPTEQRDLVLAGGPAATDTRSLHDLIHAQTARTPDMIAAVAFGPDGTEQHLTYRGLAAASARLAAALRQAGVGTDTLVALPGRRSLDVVVALVAVLRAGGAFVLVETDDPPERVRRALTAAGVRFAVGWADAHLALPPECREIEPGRSGSTASTPLPADHPSALAYAVHTSGSTGEPKLIGISHAAIVNYLHWCRTYGPERPGRTVVHSRLSFDLTLTSLLTPLTRGGTVILTPHDDPAALLPGLLRHADGPLKITPAHLAALGWQLRGGGPVATSTVVVGGEQLLGHHVQPWAAHHADTPVVNEYGPTETTVGCCVFRTTAARAPARVPIGLPIDGMRVVVMSGRRPASPNVVGELHVGGVGVARGYLGNPALTAARFVPEPGAVSSRLYRTGDLAQLGDDGLLHYVGRADRQLKVRGFRVEPAEIEHVLGTHPRVRAVAVVAVAGGPGRSRLVAYWVGDPGQVDLTTWLARRLAAHLVPADTIRVDALPLTSNGKVDHAVLAEPAFARRHRALAQVEDLGPDGAGRLLELEIAAHD